MKRIDTINVREDLFGPGKAGFHDNADLPGQDATYLSPDWLNAIQEELCNLLELRGITLDPESKRQLYDLLTTQADLEALADVIEANFIRKNQIVDNLTTSDATKVASAKQVKILNDDKANKTTTLTAGNGLSGGGTLEANRTLTLGTPSKITGSTTNSVTATSHTHEIDNASMSVAGVVKLNNTLASASTSEALTAAQGKVLNDQAFGVGQTYKDVTSSRSVNTVFTNPSSKPIFLSIDVDIPARTTARIYCGTLEVASEYSFIQSGALTANMYAVIGPQEEYRLTGATIRAWKERS